MFASGIVSLFSAGALLLGSADAKPFCWRYLVHGSNHDYLFKHYSFIDFRNRSPDYVNSTEFTDQFGVQTWNNSAFINDAANVEIVPDGNGSGTVLRLTADKKADGTQTVAEIDSVEDDYYYASVRIGARITGAPGACAGLFFYANDTQETDIEILTAEEVVHQDRDTQQYNVSATTTQAHFTTQPHTTAVRNITSGSSIVPWTQFNNYRIDWTPGRTSWFTNGEFGWSTTTNVQSAPGYLIFNMWSDGQDTWTGLMANGTQAFLDIAWIEMAYNKKADGPPVHLPRTRLHGRCSLGDGTGVPL